MVSDENRRDVGVGVVQRVRDGHDAAGDRHFQERGALAALLFLHPVPPEDLQAGAPWAEIAV